MLFEMLIKGRSIGVATVVSGMKGKEVSPDVIQSISIFLVKVLWMSDYFNGLGPTFVEVGLFYQTQYHIGSL
jgi:hypothetical protein